MKPDVASPDVVLADLHSTGLANLQGPDLLLGYQKRLLEATVVNRVTVVEKSRRTGYTWGVGADAVLTSAAARKAGGMDSLYIGYNLDMAREFIDTCAGWARLFHHAAEDVQDFLFDDGEEGGEQKFIQAFRISFASGFDIIALASRPRSLRGRQGYVIIDEAAFHDDLEALMRAALALLIWGGKVLVISTHYGAGNYFNKLIAEIDAGRSKFKKLRCTLDDALADGLYRRICLVKGDAWSAEAETAWRKEIVDFYGDGADEELFCIPRNAAGQFLPRPLIEARMVAGIPILRWSPPAPDFVDWSEERRRENLQPLLDQITEIIAELPKNTRCYAGGDFGRTGDLSAIWPIALMQDMVRKPPLVLELRQMPFSDQEMVLKHLLHALPIFEHGKFDATGIGAQISEAMRQEFGVERVEEVKLSTEWYRVNMPPFKSAFERAELIMPKDSDLLADHELIVLTNGVAQLPTMRTKTAAGKRHGDSAIAHVLAHAASRAVVEMFGYQSITGSEERNDGMRARHDDDLPRDKIFGRPNFGPGGF